MNSWYGGLRSSLASQEKKKCTHFALNNIKSFVEIISDTQSIIFNVCTYKEKLPSLRRNFIEVSNVLTRSLHGAVECHLTLLACKIHLFDKENKLRHKDTDLKTLHQVHRLHTLPQVHQKKKKSHLDFVATNLPTFGFPYSCLSKVRVVIQDEGHPF